MSDDEIEFFISDEPPDELSQREEMGGEPRRRRAPSEFNRTAAAAAFLLAAAAALPTVASFQGVYTIRQGGGDVRSSTNGVDGWGRYRDDPGIPSGVHEIRYGIPLVACAGVLALLAVALVTTLLRNRDRQTQRREQTVIMLIAMIATSVLGGVAVSMWLHIQSLFDTLHAQAADFPRSFGGQFEIETGIGACPWLTLAGVVAGLLAVDALWHAARAESGATERPGKLA